VYDDTGRPRGDRPLRPTPKRPRPWHWPEADAADGALCALLSASSALDTPFAPPPGRPGSPLSPAWWAWVRAAALGFRPLGRYRPLKSRDCAAFLAVPFRDRSRCRAVARRPYVLGAVPNADAEVHAKSVFARESGKSGGDSTLKEQKRFSPTHRPGGHSSRWLGWRPAGPRRPFRGIKNASVVPTGDGQCLVATPPWFYSVIKPHNSTCLLDVA
jgi:hypothetical protein